MTVYPTIEKLGLLLALAVGATAQTTTTVTGTMTSPAGDMLAGSCSIQAVASFTAAAGWRVIGTPMLVRFTGGAFTATLAPTDGSAPAYYRVSCAVPQQMVGGHSVGPFSWGPRYWVVPTSSTSVDIGTVEMTSAPTSPLWMINWPQLAQNGAQAGQVPIWTGSAWQPGSVGDATVTNTAVVSALGFSPAPLDSNGLVPAANVPGLTGDVAKNAGANATTVVAIRNYPVTSGAPSDGQLMRWSATAGQWKYVTKVEEETPGGTIDGTNVAFTLASSPVGKVVLTRNGLIQQTGGDFTLSGNTVTFNVASTPQSGDNLLAWYWH
jgi:hypothetical protein